MRRNPPCLRCRTVRNSREENTVLLRSASFGRNANGPGLAGWAVTPFASTAARPSGTCYTVSVTVSPGGYFITLRRIFSAVWPSVRVSSTVNSITSSSPSTDACTFTGRCPPRLNGSSRTRLAAVVGVAMPSRHSPTVTGSSAASALAVTRADPVVGSPTATAAATVSGSCAGCSYDRLASSLSCTWSRHDAIRG